MKSFVLCLFLQHAIAVDRNGGDVRRAKLAAPRSSLTAASPAAIRELLNERLANGDLAIPKLKACDEFSLSELADWQRLMQDMAAPDLVEALHPHDRRRPRFSDAAALEASLAGHTAAAEAHPKVYAAVRDARCAELAMRWVHHLTDEQRAEVSDLLASDDGAALPLLPSKGSAEHGPWLRANGHSEVADEVADTVTCETGHSAHTVKPGTWTGYPDWPDEVQYNASGFGPYPFWSGGTPGGGSLTAPGTAIATSWSALLNSERLDHAMCSLSSIDPATPDGPCASLFVGSPANDGTGSAYLFSADESSFCCVSSTPDISCTMTAPERDFYKYFTYNGVSDGYVSESGYYSGPVMNYSMHLTDPSNFYFWYYTDMDGFPVEQGEGACVMPRGCPGAQGPKYLFHQYDRATIAQPPAPFQANSTFAVPAVCLGDHVPTCEVTPDNLCANAPPPQP